MLGHMHMHSYSLQTLKFCVHCIILYSQRHLWVGRLRIVLIFLIFLLECVEMNLHQFTLIN
jgi:hypothetical protein